MNELYLNRDIFGNTIPENAEEILAALNLEIQEFVAKNGLNPEEDDDDFTSVECFASHISSFYRLSGMTPKQAIENGWRVLSNLEIANEIKSKLYDLNFGWYVEFKGWGKEIIDELDTMRDSEEEALPADPKSIELYIAEVVERYTERYNAKTENN